MKTRVIFLTQDLKVGGEAYSFLKQQDCDIVLEVLDNTKVKEFPEYDLGLGYSYLHRIPESEFQVPYKWVNFHPAPLPEYGGRNIAYQAIMEGVKEYGATIHYMDKTFDTGEIIEVFKVPVLSYYTAGDLLSLARFCMDGLFRKWVPELLKGKVPSTKQTNTRYFKKRDINNFVSLTKEQETLVRALTLHPTFHAKINIAGKIYKIIPEEV